MKSCVSGGPHRIPPLDAAECAARDSLHGSRARMSFMGGLVTRCLVCDMEMNRAEYVIHSVMHPSFLDRREKRA